MYPLALQMNPAGWRAFTARKSDPAFNNFSKKVLRRDNYTCQFCGFQARDFQEIINLDQDYANNKISNLAVACCFCTQCFFIESVGAGGFGGGNLIYLPEFSQNDLDSLCHVVFCAIANDTGYKTTAQAIYRSLKLRSQAVDEQFGEGSSIPAIFGQLIVEADAEKSSSLAKILENLRLLPSRASFREQIQRWATTALNEMNEAN